MFQECLLACKRLSVQHELKPNKSNISLNEPKWKGKLVYVLHWVPHSDPKFLKSKYSLFTMSIIAVQKSDSVMHILLLGCSVTKSCPTFCNLMDCSMLGFPVLHYLLEFAQIHVHWVTNAIQPSHPLPPSSLFAFNLSQHQGLFQWAGSWHQVATVLELQLQHQSFQWMFRTDFT